MPSPPSVMLCQVHCGTVGGQQVGVGDRMEIYDAHIDVNGYPILDCKVGMDISNDVDNDILVQDEFGHTTLIVDVMHYTAPKK